jgi:hypothetical protein
MPLSSKLDRKLRAAEESSDDEEYYEVTDRSSSPSLIETGEGGELLDSDDEEGDEDGSEDEDMVCRCTSTLLFSMPTRCSRTTQRTTRRRK